MCSISLAHAQPPDEPREDVLYQCQSNLKRLGIGIFIYSQDHDEKPPPAEKWQEEILPYLEDKKSFRCPAAEPVGSSYSYNSEVQDLSLFSIGVPEQTILIYEGKNKKFDFRHEADGVKLTNILFADGHVKSFSEETLDAAMKDQMLQWKLEQ